ncbi:MAG: GNAT family N-acetyltransferase [Deltaproteobacteria bacterium]|nr:GNAT family N-acetyltransferase [Deltaproteobacteria bacterium]
MPDWTMEPYAPGDEEGILALRKAVFGNADPVRTRPEAWKWQFADNPAGHGFIMLAKHGAKVVGQYAAIPTRMLVAGQPETWGFSCDTMVHPDYRRRGMFTDLALALYQHMDMEHGVFVVWGFPNENSLPGFIGRLGWKTVEALPVRVGAHPLLMASPLLVATHRMQELTGRLARGLSVERVRAFGPEFDELWDRHAPRDGVIQVRDAAFLSWRYLGLSAFGYRAYALRRASGALAGWFVLRSLPLFRVSSLVLVDWFFPLLSAKQAVAVLARVRRHAAASGRAACVALFPARQASLARRAGFLAVPGRLSPKTFTLAGRNLPPGVENPSSWRTTLGDADIV